MSKVINKHSRMPRKLSRLTLRRREQQAIVGSPHMLAEVDPKAIIAKYMSGERIKDIAPQYGVSKVGMYAFLLRNAREEWMEAQQARAFAMKEEGEERTIDASDPLELAKGREIGRFGQWDLERVDRKNYGRDEQTVNINITDLGDRLRRARERVIDANVQTIEEKSSTCATLNLARPREEAA